MVLQKLNLKYIRGKQVICLAAIIITVLGFVLDAITYFSIYSRIQIALQSVTLGTYMIAIVYFLTDRNKYYGLSFSLVSYGLIINILLTAIFINSLNTESVQTQTNILSRDVVFIIIMIALSGFMIGQRHIFIQGILLISLMNYFIFVQRAPFFVENAAIYFVSVTGFLFVLYFFVGILDDLISGLEESNTKTTAAKRVEVGKNQALLKFQSALLQLTKDESLFEDIETLFRKICATAAQNLETSRVSIWMLTDNNTKMCRKHLYESATENNDVLVLERKDYPLYFVALESRPYILASDAREHPETKEFKDVYLKSLDIYSLLDCPIVMAGKPIGVICCEHQQSIKEWTNEDILFIQSLSAHISIFYQNLQIKDLLEQVRQSNFELVEKGNEIETMNEELNSLNEELSTLNDSLEQTVRHRTSELETQNKQLTEYAFINSHILRAPLARILGVSQIISESGSTSIKDKQLLDALIRSCNELDTIIKKISDILYDGNNLSREDIQVLIDKKVYKN